MMDRSLRALALLLSFACLFLSPSLVHAQTERILDYHSDIEVRNDASMIVTETIRVVSAQEQIRHGIYRDFPTRYTDRLGNRYVVGFEFVGATRDGEPETARVEDRSNGKRIYLGRANSFVPPGEHTYTITYTTNRQFGFFPDHDELFWNVTGNGWIFTIEQASATVRLGPAISSNQVHLSGYTGPQGSMRSDLTESADGDGTFGFQTTRPLASYSGLTIRLQFPKGHFIPPTTADQMRYFARDNAGAVFGGIGFVVILLYYLAVWAYAGRDPAPGTIVVQYEPPANFSPAAMRYLVRMGYDNKVFAASVIDMAVRGYVTIKQQAGSYTLYRTKADTRVLSPDEKAVANALFGDGRDMLWLHNENHVTISAAMTALKLWLKTAEQKIYFVTNGIYLLPAIVISALVVIAIVASQGGPKVFMVGFICFWLSFWSIAVYGLVFATAHLWSASFEGGTAKPGSIGQALLITFFSIPFLGGEVMGFWFLIQAASGAIALILLAMIALHVLFHHLLKAPTRAGRAVLDKIDGFKMFLGAVDGDRMNRVTPVDKTPEVFEKFLPYALSLDLEHAWAQQFAGVFDGASRIPGAQSSGYSPAWFSGSDFNSMGATGFASSLAGSFSSAISSSSTAPGSSGGGGGGGGSGGGGGGGGGGGW